MMLDVDESASKKILQKLFNIFVVCDIILIEENNMNYKIKQLTKRTDYRFMDYDFAIKNGFNLNDYDLTYEGEIEAEKTPMAILEDLFYIFNVERPDDFHGHSLSTSDVVELDGVNYYCDWAGWKKL